MHWLLRGSMAHGGTWGASCGTYPSLQTHGGLAPRKANAIFTAFVAYARLFLQETCPVSDVQGHCWPVLRRVIHCDLYHNAMNVVKVSYKCLGAVGEVVTEQYVARRGVCEPTQLSAAEGSMHPLCQGTL